jgi:hypothetical protein
MLRSLACTAVTLLVSLCNLEGAECAVTRQVAPGDTIRELAEFYFGNTQYWPAILLATNSRKDFAFISDLNDLRRTPKLCIPEIAEAERWRLRYERYLAAMGEASLPEPWKIAPRLVEFPADQPVTVSSWIREAQLNMFRDSTGKWLDRAPSELWVTVEPYLRKFCAAFVSAHGSDLDQLTLRLEQRLGLPPSSNKTQFLEIRLARPEPDVIFRPCVNPSTTTTNCPVGPPPAGVDERHKNWIYRQYYSSYGQGRLSSFPWTALGYTFDWAPGPQGNSDFQRFGESEFVIRQGAPIEIVQALSTGEYCKPN